MKFNVLLHDERFEVECEPVVAIRDLLRVIEKKYWSLSGSRTWIRYLQNAKASIVDNDYAVGKALDDGETITANTGRIEAYRANLNLSCDLIPRKKHHRSGARPLNSYEKFRASRFAEHNREEELPLTFRGLLDEWRSLSKEEKEAYSTKQGDTHQWRLRYEQQDGKAANPGGNFFIPTLRRLVAEHDLVDLNDTTTMHIVLERFNLIMNRKDDMDWLRRYLITKLGYTCSRT